MTDLRKKTPTEVISILEKDFEFYSVEYNDNSLTYSFYMFDPESFPINGYMGDDMYNELEIYNIDELQELYNESFEI
jgi:hypothetical protein